MCTTYLHNTFSLLSFSANILSFFSRLFPACKRKEEEHGKPGDPKPPKKPRLVFTDIQRRTLHAIFKETKRPSKEMQATIAQQLGLEVSTVANFFMNARRRSLDKWQEDLPPEKNPSTATRPSMVPIAPAINETVMTSIPQSATVTAVPHGLMVTAPVASNSTSPSLSSGQQLTVLGSSDFGSTGQGTVALALPPGAAQVLNAAGGTVQVLPVSSASGLSTAALTLAGGNGSLQTQLINVSGSQGSDPPPPVITTSAAGNLQNSVNAVSSASVATFMQAAASQILNPMALMKQVAGGVAPLSPSDVDNPTLTFLPDQGAGTSFLLLGSAGPTVSTSTVSCSQATSSGSTMSGLDEVIANATKLVVPGTGTAEMVVLDDDSLDQPSTSQSTGESGHLANARMRECADLSTVTKIVSSQLAAVRMSSGISPSSHHGLNKSHPVDNSTTHKLPPLTAGTNAASQSVIISLTDDAHNGTDPDFVTTSPTGTPVISGVVLPPMPALSPPTVQDQHQQLELSS